MTLHRLTVKIPAKDPSSIDLESFIPLFHRFIQRDALEGQQIDVADYSHVPEGPGVMLIGHEYDYALDETDGERGLMARLKRDVTGTPSEQLHDALRRLVKAAIAVEADEKLPGQVRFDTRSMRITFDDRLQATNSPEGFARFSGDVASTVSAFFGGEEVDVKQAGGPKDLLTFRVTCPTAPDLATLGQKH